MPLPPKTNERPVIYPLLADIYLHMLDTVWKTKRVQEGRLIRYADDFVVLDRAYGDARHRKI